MLGRRGLIFLGAMVSVLMLALSSLPATGHSPAFPSSNTSIETAWEVHDPSKSWAIYTTLPEGKAHYYKMDLQKGDRILINLIIPVKEHERGFLPVMTLIGPGLTAGQALPSLIEVPDGLGHVYVPSDHDGDPEFEPFSPGTYVKVSSLDMDAPEGGTYYVAVWEHPSSPGKGGNYAFPVGFKESFTFEEIVLIPFSLLKVYVWEGQEQSLTMLPMVVMLILGFFVFLWKRYELIPRMRMLHYSAYFAGLLIAGSGLVTTVQLIRSVMEVPIDGMVLVTLSIIFVQIGIGVYLVRSGYTGKKMTTAARAVMFLMGIVALLAWAGYIIGPAMAMIGSLLPAERRGG
ncbi:MAG: hypothetical protein HPY73_06170 [Methanomassiliicoccales archaeon]|nr:MAG: hypothetical protein HPY73_06170 [Methanomassiliicoccales archaeon]